MLDFNTLNLSKTGDGLLPVIIQNDVTLKVLMLGYMNAEAFEKSQKEGKVTFYSRTRSCLWTKGETSGNFLNIVSIAVDCDNDTLLVRVNPIGPTCHNGTVSCFDDNANEGFVRHLADFIAKRHKEMPEGSYTTHLFNKGITKIAQKVGEEAVETVIDAVDGNRDGFIYEASDLVYHLLVLLEAMGCTWADVENELVKRHK